MSLNRSLLRRTLSVQTASRQDQAMTAFLLAELKRLRCRVYRDRGNLYATKGVAQVYPTIVAHTDTVHELIPDHEWLVLSARGYWFGWNPLRQVTEGVGGDDKIGVFLALECLRRLPACKAVFFRDEEIGCLGSIQADLRFFDDSAFVLQGDRKGNGDFVRKAGQTKLHGAEFGDAVAPMLAKRQYKPHDGGMGTDVVALREVGLAVASANLSCGYYEPHGPDEYVIERDVANCLGLMLEISRTIGHTQWTWTKKVIVPDPKVPKIDADVIAKWPWMRHYQDRDALHNEMIANELCLRCGNKTIVWDEGGGQHYCAKCNMFLSFIVLEEIEKRIARERDARSAVNLPL